MKIEREKLIAEIHNSIKNSQDLTEIFNHCVNKLRIFSQCDRVLIYQFQPDWSGRIVAESVAENILTTLGNIIIDSCFQSQAQVIYPKQFPIIVNNIYLTKYAECHIKLLEKYQVKSNLVLPIYLHNQLWGLLIGHQCQDYRHWKLEDIDLFEEVSNQLKNIITRKITEQKSTEIQLRESRDLNQWVAQINSHFINVTTDNFALEVNQTLQFIGEKVNSDRLCIFFFDDSSETMVMKYGWMSSECQILCQQVIQYNMLPCSCSLLKQGKSCLITNMDKLATFPQIEVENWRKMGAGSVFLNPLIWQNEIIGFIGTCCSEENHNWTENQLQLISIIGQTILNSHLRIEQEKELKLTTDRLQKAQQISRLGHWEYNIQKNEIIYWSEEIYKIYEVDPQDFTPSYPGFLAIVHPNDQELLNKSYWQHVEQKVPYDLIHRLQMPDGRIKYLYEQCETQYAEDGTPLYSSGVTQDVTPLKEAELKLQKLNEELEKKVIERTNELQQVNTLQQAILNSTEYAIISIDTKGIIQTFNRGAEKIFGYKEKDVIQKVTCRKFVDLSTVQDLATTISQKLGREVMPNLEILTIKSNLGMVNDFKLTCIRKNGSRFPLSVSVNPLKNETGEIIGFVGVCKDITTEEQAEQKRKKAEEQLKASEARFRRVFQSDIVGFLFTNFSGQIYSANDRFLEIIGYTRADLETGLINWVNITPPEYYQQDLDVIARLQNGSDVEPWEKAYYHKDGHLVYVLLGVALIDDHGDCVSIVVDISEKKQQEIELQKTNIELARATRLKDEFLASMSHELRTPLNAILGMTEVLSEGIFGEVNNQQQKYLKTIDKSGTHLLGLINDILDIAKIESGKLELELIPTSIKSLCSSSIAFIQQQALNKRIKIETNLPQVFPKVLIDENRICQVLINLLTNAVKFTPEGGQITLEIIFTENYADYSSFAPINWIPYKAELTPDLNLSPEYLSPSHYVLISIVDTGIGISQKNIDKLFQPFIQIDSALNRQYSGTGLGLVLVQRIIQLHGGQVGLCTVEGKGSNFIVTLPCVENPEYFSKTITYEKDKSRFTANSDKPFLILLAEDDPANIITTSDYLKAKGYQLIVAQNGEEAIFLAEKEKPDLIIMDVQMPKLDGLTAIKQIRLNSDLAQTPIIAFTALAMENDEQRCLEAGANKYITKPIPLKQLNLAIQEML